MRRNIRKVIGGGIEGFGRRILMKFLMSLGVVYTMLMQARRSKRMNVM